VGGGWRRGRTRLIATVATAALVVVLTTGSSMVLSTNGQYVSGFNSRDFVCEGSAPTICLNRGYGSAMAPLREEFALFNEKTAGTSLVARQLQQNSEGVGDEPPAGTRSVYIETIDSLGMTTAVSRYAAKYGGAVNCDFTAGNPEPFWAVSIVNAWLTGYDEMGFETFDVSAPGVAEFHRFLSLSVADGNAWLRANESAYLACTLTFDELP